MPGVPATKGISASVARGAASLARSCSSGAASCLARFFGDPAKSFAPSRVRTRVRTPTLRIHPGQVTQGPSARSEQRGTPQHWGMPSHGAALPNLELKNAEISCAHPVCPSLAAGRGVGGRECNPLHMALPSVAHARACPRPNPSVSVADPSRRGRTRPSATWFGGGTPYPLTKGTGQRA